MSNASFELPNAEIIIIDGYKIDLSGGALGGQALVYNSGSNTFIAADAYGTVSGSFSSQQIAYSNGTFSLTGNSNFTFNDAYKALHVGGDGYFTNAIVLNDVRIYRSGTRALTIDDGYGGSLNTSTWAGALTANTFNSSLVQTDNINQWGGGVVTLWAGGTGDITIGNSTRQLIVANNILPTSNNSFSLGSSSAKWKDGYFGGKISLDGYTFDLSAGATSGQVLTFNGTSFIAQNATGGISGTLTSTKVPYATGASTLADSGMAWDNTNKILTITTLAGNDGLAVTDGTRALGLFVNYNGSAVGALGTTTSHNLVFFTNSQAAQMILNTSGNLGIGVSPNYKLDVNGDVHISANRLIIDASSASVSPSGTGAIRFNTSTNHLEFSENAGSWTQFGAGSGGLTGSLTSTKIPYATGASTLADSGVTWDNTNKVFTVTTTSSGTFSNGLILTNGTEQIALTTVTTATPSVQIGSVSNHPLDFYTNNASQQLRLTTSGAFQIYGSTASVSAASTGAIRFNSGTSHLEFSENGGSWTQFGSGGGSMAIGSAITSATNNRVLYADGSGNLGDTILSLTSSELGPVTNGAVSLGDSSHKFVDGYFSGKISLDGYSFDLSAGATSNQVLQYNGTAFIAATVSGGGSTSSVVDCANTKELLLTTTGATTVATYPPTSSGNFIIYIYYRVITGATTLTLTLTWTDATGAQTQTVINTQSQAVGSYLAAPIYINATTATAITVTATAGTANRIYVSSDILQMAGSGTTVADEYSWTLKNYYDNLAVNKSAGSANEVHGSMFYFTKSATITGAQFFWGDATAKTIRVKLWDNSGNQLKSVDIAVNGAGWYIATFASAYSASAYTAYVVSHWETTGALSWRFNMRGASGSPIAANFDAFAGTASSTPVIAGAHFYWMAWNLWSTGDVIPNSFAGSEKYAIEPAFTLP